MRNIAFPNLLKTFREYVLMTAGLLIYSFGWIACIKPMEVAAGGGTGLAMIVSHTAAEMWGVDIRIGTVFLTINAFLLLLSGLTVGWNFGFKTLFCIVVASGFMALMEPYFMVHYPPSGDVLGLDDKLLTIILGALLAGAGMAVCFTAGGATGGTDIVAMLLQKFAGIKFSTGILLADGFVVLSGLAVIGFGLGTGDAASNGWMLTLYSLITIYISSRVIAYLLDGASYDKLLFIISDHHEQLKRFIIEDLDRSATYIKSKGMYTDALRDMIFLVVSRKEVRLVQHKIKEIDPSAFVVVTDAYETFGEGFKQFPDKNEIHAE